MSDVIKNLKSIVRKYKTSLDINTPFRFSDKDLETLRKAIKYLELVNGLAETYQVTKSDKYE